MIENKRTMSAYLKVNIKGTQDDKRVSEMINGINFGRVEAHHKIFHGSNDNLTLLLNANLSSELPFEFDNLKSQILLGLKEFNVEIDESFMNFKNKNMSGQNPKLEFNKTRPLNAEPFKNITNQLTKKGQEFNEWKGQEVN